ncbi:unnamed protein product [Trichogramma brassicae]|uniref:Uncharacterized protein n=1 Tax=Trichogramma brassicae TaxID=86971 RepID=A0A6H5HY25_9HYME|nr:unnamed protein product [Trichogramma brassicae]
MHEPRAWTQLISDLFKICGRLDVNYTDESGYTHFHAACEFNCPEIVRGFLEHGQDPNCVWPKTGDSALHIVLRYAEWDSDIIEILLRGGADPNVANKEGLTPLHVIAQQDWDCEIVELFFQINDELNQRYLQYCTCGYRRVPVHTHEQFSIHSICTRTRVDSIISVCGKFISDYEN